MRRTIKKIRSAVNSKAVGFRANPRSAQYGVFENGEMILIIDGGSHFRGRAIWVVKDANTNPYRQVKRARSYKHAREWALNYVKGAE